jgi:hypothetical protein
LYRYVNNAAAGSSDPTGMQQLLPGHKSCFGGGSKKDFDLKDFKDFGKPSPLDDYMFKKQAPRPYQPPLPDVSCAPTRATYMAQKYSQPYSKPAALVSLEQRLAEKLQANEITWDQAVAELQKQFRADEYREAVNAIRTLRYRKIITLPAPVYSNSQQDSLYGAASAWRGLPPMERERPPDYGYVMAAPGSPEYNELMRALLAKRIDKLGLGYVLLEDIFIPGGALDQFSITISAFAGVGIAPAIRGPLASRSRRPRLTRQQIQQAERIYNEEIAALQNRYPAGSRERPLAYERAMERYSQRLRGIEPEWPPLFLD